MGYISGKVINNSLMSFKLTPDDSIQKIVVEEFKLMKTTDSIKLLSKAFSRHQCIIVEDNKRNYFIAEHRNVLDHFMKNVKN